MFFWEAKRVRVIGPTGWNVPLYRIGPNSDGASSTISSSRSKQSSMVLESE
jgi:hypothetical protein